MAGVGPPGAGVAGGEAGGVRRPPRRGRSGAAMRRSAPAPPLEPAPPGRPGPATRDPSRGGWRSACLSGHAYVRTSAATARTARGFTTDAAAIVFCSPVWVQAIKSPCVCVCPRRGGSRASVRGYSASLAQPGPPWGGGGRRRPVGGDHFVGLIGPGSRAVPPKGLAGLAGPPGRACQGLPGLADDEVGHKSSCITRALPRLKSAASPAGRAGPGGAPGCVGPPAEDRRCGADRLITSVGGLCPLSPARQGRG